MRPALPAKNRLYTRPERYGPTFRPNLQMRVLFCTSFLLSLGMLSRSSPKNRTEGGASPKKKLQTPNAAQIDLLETNTASNKRDSRRKSTHSSK